MIVRNPSKAFLKLFADCIPIKGKDRSAIYSLATQQIRLIPNEMYDLILELENFSIGEVKPQYEDYADTFDEYLDFLLNNNFSFLTDTPELFPKMIYQYFTPSTIISAVIEYGGDKYDFKSIIEELNQMNCKQLEIRFDNELLTLKELVNYLEYLDDKSFRDITLLIKYSKQLSPIDINLLNQRFSKVAEIIIYGIDKELVFKESETVTYISTDLTLKNQFPQNIHLMNIEYFMEANLYNPYYNNKVVINQYGYIKNCLLHSKDFGNVNFSTLRSVINTEEFRALWYIKHDLIDGIKDSELRYCKLISNDLVQNEAGTFKLLDKQISSVER